MARYLLDTDAIIDHLSGIQSSVSVIRDLHANGHLLCTCDVVVAEVYSGLRPADREDASRLLGALSHLSTPREAARQAGEWRCTYGRKGKSLATADVLVAATAYAHQATIVTGNRADYPMPEVSLLPLPRSRS